METNLLLIRVLAKANNVKNLDFISLHSMCRQDVAEPKWGYFVMVDDTTYLVLTLVEFELLSLWFGEPHQHLYGTTASASLEHLNTLLNLEIV